MNYPRLTFPLIADFGSTEYWINDIGPFKYGTAVTEFFCGGDLTDNVGDGLLLMRRLEEVLQAFGGHLHPYVQEQPTSKSQFSWPEKTPIEGSVCFAVHSVDGDEGVMVERWTISCLRDFLYLELGKAIDKGNMGREEFNAWVEHAAAQRDFTIELLKTARSEEERAQHLEALREDLNRL